MKIFVFCAALLLLAAAASPGSEAGNSAAEVRRIFEEKCVDCHSAHLGRPKGDFGYVLDLKRVAENPDFIERGHPGQSELYRLIETDEMPGEDADVPPLTAAEKDAVKRWIILGAPDDSAPAAASSPPTAPRGSKPALSTRQRTLRWLGHFHPATTHFPIALMFVAVFADALAWWTRRDSWMHTVRFLVLLAALSAVLTAGLGWANAAFSSYNKETGALLWWHRWLGTGASAWALLCGALVLMNDCVEGTRERRRLRGALLLGAALVGSSGFLGSALIYGLNHYAW